MFKEKYIKTKKDLTIFTESAGSRNNPPVLLIMGAMNQGLFWYDSFCRFLSENGFFVIRYDHRDTGFSSAADYKNAPYDLNDLTDDAVEIMDSYEIEKAHFIGLSMGGYISQLLGVNYPGRVKTLTMISTTADHRPYMDATAGNFSSRYDLSYPEKSFLDYIEKSSANLPANETEIISNHIEGWKAVFNNISGNDLDEISRLVQVSYKRSSDKFSAFNNGMAVHNSAERTGLLKKIKARTFIFHGEKDPCFPPDHGIFLHSLIKNSTFEMVKNMGHMFTLTEADYLSGKIIHNLGASQGTVK